MGKQKGAEQLRFESQDNEIDKRITPLHTDMWPQMRGGTAFVLVLASDLIREHCAL